MSEKENPFQKILDSIDSRLKNLESKSAPSPSTEKPTNSEPPHTHSANVMFDCPECEELYKKEVEAKVLKAQKAKYHKMENPQLCEDCGEIYDQEENEDCPSCHGKTEE